MKINPLYKFLISSYSLSTFSEGILMPIYAVFVQKIGGDILDASGAIAIFFITEGIFTMLIHRFKWSNDHRTFLLVSGWVIWLLGIISYLFVANMLTLFLAQVLMALGNATADPIFYRELSENTDRRSKGFEWGFFEGIKVILDGVAALIGGVVATFWGFHFLILTMIGTATLSLVAILVYLYKKSRLTIFDKMAKIVN
jgi:hypothetical protein